MPMTLPGLRAIGLSDWPAWHRALNPGYFASASQNKGARSVACAGDSCCTAHTSNSVLAQKKEPRLRDTVAVIAGKGLDASEGMWRAEMGGQQTLMGLRNMQRESGGNATSGKDHVSKNVMLERAAVKDTKDWEEESDSSDDSEVAVKGGATKEKLVDI